MNYVVIYTLTFISCKIDGIHKKKNYVSLGDELLWLLIMAINATTRVKIS